jgi:hypothetical protein
MRFLFTWMAILVPAIAQGQQQLEWNWNRMHIAIDSSVESDLGARSGEIIHEFYVALNEAENTLGYKASGSLHFEAFNDANEYELALREHSAYRHLQGLSIEDANDGIFPLYLHATKEELRKQLRWGIAYSLLREYLFGITVKQRFDQAKLTRLPAWVLYGFCRYFAMGWEASDQDEWQYFFDNRAFQNSNHILAQSQDVYGQFVWNELSHTLGKGTLSSFWFVIKYTGQIDAAFQYHLGLDFHEWMAPYLIQDISESRSSSLFQSDLDWGSNLMGHPILDMILDSVPNRGVATFYWPGKQVIAFSDFERNHRWVRMRDQVSLCRELCFSRTLIWNHKDGQDWESLWKEDDHWIWSRWSERGELAQRESWEFQGHPLQAFYLDSRLYITEQVGCHQQASIFGSNPLPHILTDRNEIHALPQSGLFKLKHKDSSSYSLFSTLEQKVVQGMTEYDVQSMVEEKMPYWSVIACQNDEYHWLFGSDSAATMTLLGELPLQGQFPAIGYTGNPQMRFITDYFNGQSRVRLYSIKVKPDSLQALSKPSPSFTSTDRSEIVTSGSVTPSIQFLGPFQKPSKPRGQILEREPPFPSMELSPHLRWYYIKHASVKLSNRRSPLLIPTELPLGQLYNSPVTPDFFTQIGSSDLRHRLEVNALISPDFKRNSLSLSQEYDLSKSLTIGQDLQWLSRRVVLDEKNKHWQSWNLELFAIRTWTNRSQLASGLSYEHAFLGSLFTSDASLLEMTKKQGMWSVHVDWFRNCSDLPILRTLDKADFSARMTAAHSPGLTGMGSADFQLHMRKQSGRQLQWNSTLFLHYAPGKDAIIYWVGGSQGWTSQNAWVTPYSEIFNHRSVWQQIGPGIRGFQSGARLGSSYAVLNQTLSSPILQYLHKGLMHSEFSKSLILFVFNDLGTSFFGWSPQAEGNPFNTQYRNTPNYALSVTSKRNPYLGSAGIGIQARMMGYHWRLERAWGYQERKVQSPIWHISMGKSIDWD